MSAPEPCRLLVVPREGLIDDPVQISVTGLSPNQPITVHATLVENGMRLDSCGHFIASSNGNVDLSQNSSISGTYIGVEPMGLFWSMKTEDRIRLVKKDVTLPYDVTLSVMDGHVPMETLTTQSIDYLCQEHVFRWYKSKDVERREIRHGNIRATMFIPPGRGPHRGVIDILGSIGGLVEFKASLLASRGFTTLALAWFAFEDLPKDPTDVNFDYFIEAVDWFKSQPEVSQHGIAVMGFSKGSDFALMLGIHCPEVKAIVSVSGSPYLVFGDLKWGNAYVQAARLKKDLQVKITDEGGVCKESFRFTDDILFDYSKMNGRVLLLLGDDDGTVSPRVHEVALSKLTPEKRSQFTSIVYPRTGHIIEPPHSPVCTSGLFMNGSKAVLIRWGGDIPFHAKAQEDYWQRIQKFFKEHIHLEPCYRKSML